MCTRARTTQRTLGGITLTNKELQDILKQYPDDAEIIRYNVYQDMNAQWSGYEKVEHVHIKLGEFEEVFNYPKKIKGLYIKI